jgi:hypothetical protein
VPAQQKTRQSWRKTDLETIMIFLSDAFLYGAIHADYKSKRRSVASKNYGLKIF